MSDLIKPVAAIIFAISLVQLANGFLGTLVSLRVGGPEFGPQAVGPIMAAYYVGYSIGAMSTGDLVQRVGHIRAFAAFSGLVAAVVALLPVFVSAPVWFLGRIAIGFGCAGLFIAAESWLSARSTAETRGAIFSYYMVATYATFAGGQFVINLASPQGFELFALASALFCIALVLVSTTRSSVPSLPKSPRLRVKELHHLAPASIGGCVLAGLVSSCFFALVPAMAQDRGFPTSTITLLVATAIAGGFTFQLPVGWLSDRFDRRAVLAGLSIGLALSSVLILMIGTQPDTISNAGLAGAFLLGGFFSSLYPVSVSHANDRVDTARAVAVSGNLILIYGLASCLGPVGGAWLIGRGGLSTLLWSICIGSIAFCILATIRFLSARKSLVPRSKVPFAAINVTPAPTLDAALDEAKRSG